MHRHMHPSNDKMETVQHELAKSRELSKPFYCASSIVLIITVGV